MEEEANTPFIMFGRGVNVSLQSKLLSFHAILWRLELELIFSSLSSYTVPLTVPALPNSRPDIHNDH
jgi:hypothetical protein